MRYFLLIAFLIISVNGFSQFTPIYSNYLMNGLSINPAYAGSRDVLSLSLMSRKQWVGFDGAPFTTSFSGNMPFKNKALAMGLIVSNEKIGIRNNFNCYANYAYRIRTNNGFLSFGLKAGFESIKDNNSEINAQDPSDAVFNNGSKGYILPNFGFGIYYYNSQFFAGLSVPTFLSYREKSQGDGFTTYNEVRNYNYLFTTGVLLNINDNFKIKPSTLLKYVANSPFQYDLNCYFIFLKEGKLWFGTSYRSNDAIVGLFEFQLNTQWRLGYSYDYSLGGLSKYNNGSHEIMLRYEFRYIVKGLNPKYF
jgi:type IX secretion system PorP/SprF family membrane protein